MKRLVYCVATFLLKTRLVSECSSPLNEILLKGKWGGVCAWGVGVGGGGGGNGGGGVGGV